MEYEKESIFFQIFLRRQSSYIKKKKKDFFWKVDFRVTRWDLFSPYIQ